MVSDRVLYKDVTMIGMATDDDDVCIINSLIVDYKLIIFNRWLKQYKRHFKAYFSRTNGLTCYGTCSDIWDANHLSSFDMCDWL